MTDFIILLLPVTLLVWGTYDIAVATCLRRRFGFPTITHRVIELSKQYPAIPFMTGLVLGLICGHLFGQF